MKPQYTTEDYIFEVNKNGGLIDFSALYHRIIIPELSQGVKLDYFLFIRIPSHQKAIRCNENKNVATQYIHLHLLHHPTV